MVQFRKLNSTMETETISKNVMSLKNLTKKANQMKRVILFFLVTCALASCSPKIYFTVDQRALLESNSVPLTSCQYYVDRDVILKREVSSQEATTLKTGKVKVEKGKYTHIITLRKNTPGVCIKVVNNRLLHISFEVGDGKYLRFGVSESDITKPSSIYNIRAIKWVNKVGEETYDGKTYYIQPGGYDAQLMFKKLTKEKLKVDKNTMKGRKVNN